MIETERLIIRHWGEADLERLFAIYSQWEVSRWVGAVRPMETMAEAETRLQRFRDQSTDPRYGVWAAELRETGVVAGAVILRRLPESEEVEVGWHLHPDSWGHGYATEAARGAIGKGFADGLAEIYAVTAPDNLRSQAVCHRLGMTSLGLTSRWYGREMLGYLLGRDRAAAAPPAH